MLPRSGGANHVSASFDCAVDPVRDLDTINSELCAKDLQFVNAAIEKEEADVKKGRSKGKNRGVAVAAFAPG